MTVEPKRNWISVSLQETVEEDKQNPHRTVEVVKDPEGEYDSGTLIVVPTHVVHEIKIKNESFHLVERNFVMAAVS